MMIHLGTGSFACAVLVIRCPTSDHGIALQHQVPSGRLPVTFHQVSNLVQKSVHVLFGRRIQQRAVILAHVSAEAITAIVYVRDPGLFRGKLQTPLSEQLLDKRIDILFEASRCRASENTIIGNPDDMHFRPLMTLVPREGSLDMLFQSMQRQVHDGR
jgi:hypothetical protein